MSQIADWVQRSHHSDEAKRKFLSGADPFIIAYALAHGHIIVTHESIDLAIKKRVKIPNVCNAFGVPYTSPFKMLRDENAKFVLPSK